MLTSQIAILQALLVFLRLVFDVLTFASCGKCIYLSSTVEKCGDNNILSQKWSKRLNATGTMLESLNSLILVTMIFNWRKFHFKNYCFAILRLGHFWVWLLLNFANILSQLMVDTVHGKNKQGIINYGGAGLIMEFFLLTFLSCAINFISKETYDAWVEEHCPRNVAKQRYFSYLYIGVLTAYFVRNFGLFLYDTALVAMSISLINGETPPKQTKDWDSVILVLMCAFRGSFVKFYFAKLFQGQELPRVSDYLNK